jgi:hypothetical protein
VALPVERALAVVDCLFEISTVLAICRQDGRRSAVEVFRRPVRVQALTVPLGTVPVARPAHVPVPVAVRHATRLAEPRVVVKTSAVDAVVAVRCAKRLGDAGRTLSGDLVAQAVTGHCPLQQQPPLIIRPVPSERLPPVAVPSLPLGGQFRLSEFLIQYATVTVASSRMDVTPSRVPIRQPHPRQRIAGAGSCEGWYRATGSPQPCKTRPSYDNTPTSDHGPYAASADAKLRTWTANAQKATCAC